MEAIEIIAELREQNFTVKADGDFFELSPVEKITEELIQRLKKHKPAILAELKREERRQKVLQMLADNQSIQRAFVTDMGSNQDDVILTVAIKDSYTFEMRIPKLRYDPFLMLELIEKGSLQ